MGKRFSYGEKVITHNHASTTLGHYFSPEWRGITWTVNVSELTTALANGLLI